MAVFSKPIFTKRHYEAIARMLELCKPDAPNTDYRYQWNYTVNMVSKQLYIDNPKFSEHKFKMECGMLVS